ncbi:hypothetical protein [Chitinophaga sp. GbtcB8]|uniref:hypothetical protein n=1 Tax=Chitinophaga sp. GbtcB8 TaxID=2824753 RepID=UPI001C3074F5|nr:hypothetical protein [Chitinophaga sp. GbtcB8]
MSKDELAQLERLMNYIAHHFIRKNRWEDVSKAEWLYISGEFNKLMQKGKHLQQETAFLGDNYFYEHLIIKRLKAAKTGKTLSDISSPNFGKMNIIAGILGYDSYMDFLTNAAALFSFHELKINIPLGVVNTALLDHLTGCWYCYNSNLPLTGPGTKEERVRRSAMEIYQSGDEYLVERSGKDNHMYYGKITAYADYIFIIMNSTTFIRQRHFIGRLKDATGRLKQKGYSVNQMNFVSTCVSFNEDPVALNEIFDRVPAKDFEKLSVDLPLSSPELPAHILQQLKNKGLHQITDY